MQEGRETGYDFTSRNMCYTQFYSPVVMFVTQIQTRFLLFISKPGEEGVFSKAFESDSVARLLKAMFPYLLLKSIPGNWKEGRLGQKLFPRMCLIYNVTLM